MNEELKIKVLNIIQNEQNPVEAIGISKRLNIDLKTTNIILIELEKELKVRVTKKMKYTPTDYLFGTISVNKDKFGFVRCLDHKDIYINKSNLRKSIDGDNVVVQIIDKKNNEGKIIKILSRSKNIEVGQVVIMDDIKYIKLDDIKKQKILLIVKESKDNLVTGHKVSVKIGSLYRDNIYYADELKLIGHINDPGIDILSKAIVYNIDTKFPDKVIKEANTIPTEVSQDEIKNRKDLRNANIFTIDGDDAKDLDDAVSIELLPNGNYLLGVHIADVSYYVKENSELDKEAYKRGTSCYLADRAIPMLPHKLSNGICSLNEKLDRLTKSTIMEFDKDGNLVNYDIFDSVINSKKRMTYKKVNDCLENNNQDSTYEPFIEDLNKMKELSDILRKKRYQDGCIKFDVCEMKIIVDEKGKAKDVIKRERMESENLIEDFMISNNVTVASHICNMDLPFVYRTHGIPANDKIEDFLAFAKVMNERVIKLPQNLHCKAIKQILESLKESPNYEIYSKLLLKCMKKAVYEINNTGHFGLSLENYTHFTSPIRRYPDLLIHRTLNKYKDTNYYYYDEEKNEKQLELLNKACKHSSLKEQNADKCERDVNKMKAAEYMENHIGEIYSGKITEVTKNGFFVDIYNGVEGFVKITDLNKGYFDKKTYRIHGNNRCFKIGDIIETSVDATIKEIGYIDLSLIDKPEKNTSLKKTITKN